MSRFLDIVENTMPLTSEQDAQSEMVDLLAKLLNKLPGVEIISTNKPEELQVQLQGSTITLNVVDVNSDIEEDDEAFTYSLDKGVEELAAKAKGGALGWAAGKMGSSYQKAKTAVKEREDVAKTGIDVYKRVTKKLRDAITGSNKELSTNYNVI
jgi:vancomycin resistance protein YoaR